LIKVAKLLRAEDLDASSAHIIEAVRLSETLATLRQLPLAGIQELDEAVKAIFCGGYDEPMALIREKLIIGDAMGKVPKEIPVIPLQEDLETLLKKCYKKVRDYYQVAEGSEVIELDLRTETHANASLLLHRLNVLGIDWGKTQSVRGNKQGSFHENWKLRWKVNFALAIIEAGMWGSTVENAATNFIKKTASETTELSKLSVLLDAAIDADLQQALPFLVQLVQNQSAVTKDVLDLMQTLPILVTKIRYGTVRKIDLSAIEMVVHQIIPRIFIGLPAACQGIDEEAAMLVFQALQNTNRALSLLNNADTTKQWHQVLLQMTELKAINGIIAGESCRILFEKHILDLEQTAQKMAFSLSSSNDAIESAGWIQGFLSGSGLLLIYNHALWNILDSWVEQLPYDKFTEILPLLRRTFAAFDTPERQKMMDLAKKGQVNPNNYKTKQDLNPQRVAIMLPKLQTFF
jgi:hypothetical protein